MLGLCCNETYGVMTNHGDRYDDRDNDRNEDGNDEDNAASGSGSDGPIFDPIMTPRSRLGLAEENRATKMTALRPRRHMYLRVGIYVPYKYPINAILNMCDKLLYAKIGGLDLLMLLKHEKKQLN